MSISIDRLSGGFVAAALSALCVLGCAGDAVAPETPGSNAGSEIASVQLDADTTAIEVGARRDIAIIIRARNGRRIPSAEAEVSVLTSALAEIDGVRFVDVEGADGRVTAEQVPTVRFRAPGHVVVRVRIGTVAKTIDFDVRYTLPAGPALVVDTFTVIEYRAPCVWECPYLVYAPLLTLREPTGVVGAEVVAVEFTIPGMSTGLCSGVRAYGPGQRLQLNGMFEYLWSNDLIFVSLDGTPVPDGLATARVHVRSANGGVSVIEATAPIQRGVVNPVLPPPTWPTLGWVC